jgi:hypothetical protein
VHTALFIVAVSLIITEMRVGSEMPRPAWVYLSQFLSGFSRMGTA